jgi:phosphoribosylaminoimidazole-succinocarboxamide synthase
MEDQAVKDTDLAPLTLKARGKVRDIYDLGDRLLIVTTDRISAFDVILNEPIPDKGRVLSGLSAFWMQKVSHIVPNHLISTDLNDFPPPCPDHAGKLRDRAALVRKAEPFPVECVVRGYIIGSGWKDYQKTGAICGVKLPQGLKQADKLPEPIFTPSTKAEIGEHDENISFDKVVDKLGSDMANWLKERSLELYGFGARWAEERGVIIADTKFEFGLIDGEPHLIDEALTPDSSRFWPAEIYEPGSSPPSLDKQFVRDYLEGVEWDKTPPPPPLPTEIISKTREKYLEIYRILAGSQL